MIRLGWDKFKHFCVANNLSMTYVEYDGFYLVWAPFGGQVFESLVSKNCDEQIDFETNFKR